MKRLKILVVWLVFMLSFVNVGKNSLTAYKTGSYVMDWHDEFHGSSLDLTKWRLDSEGQRRGGINTMESVRVEDGFLKIHTNTIDGKHYTAMLSTENSFHALYGYFEARVKFNSAAGMWSNFWLYSQDMGRYRDNLDKCGMEVDIFEHRNTNGDGADYKNSLVHCIHWDGYREFHRANLITVDNILHDGFNVIGLEWTPEEYIFYVNGKETWRTKPVTSRPMFILLSCELGYDWWAGSIPHEGYNNDFIVDYVRYYKKQ